MQVFEESYRRIWKTCLKGLDLQECEDLEEFPLGLRNLVTLNKLCFSGYNSINRVSKEFGTFVSLKRLRMWAMWGSGGVSLRIEQFVGFGGIDYRQMQVLEKYSWRIWKPNLSQESLHVRMWGVGGVSFWIEEFVGIRGIGWMQVIEECSQRIWKLHVSRNYTCKIVSHWRSFPLGWPICWPWSSLGEIRFWWMQVLEDCSWRFWKFHISQETSHDELSRFGGVSLRIDQFVGLVRIGFWGCKSSRNVILRIWKLLMSQENYTCWWLYMLEVRQWWWLRLMWVC